MSTSSIFLNFFKVSDFELSSMTITDFISLKYNFSKKLPISSEFRFLITIKFL